jgi:hypothetical protein
MNTQDLRDKTGRLKGRIKESSNKLEIYSSIGRKLGYYDYKTDQTRTVNGSLIGYGNLLTTLL